MNFAWQKLHLEKSWPKILETLSQWHFLWENRWNAWYDAERLWNNTISKTKKELHSKKICNYEWRKKPSCTYPSSVASNPDSGTGEKAVFDCCIGGCGVWFHSEVVWELHEGWAATDREDCAFATCNYQFQTILMHEVSFNYKSRVNKYRQDRVSWYTTLRRWHICIISHVQTQTGKIMHTNEQHIAKNWYIQ